MSAWIADATPPGDVPVDYSQWRQMQRVAASGQQGT
jgi:hypothetical protein